MNDETHPSGSDPSPSNAAPSGPPASTDPAPGGPGNELVPAAGAYGEPVPAVGVVSAVVSAEAPGGVPGAEAATIRALTAEERLRVDKIKETVDITDPNMVIQYGLPAQSKIAAFADSLLADLRTKDADAAGEAMTELLAKVKELDVDGLTKGSQGSRIPLVGRFVDRVKRFDARYEKLSVTVDKLLTVLERTRMGLLKDITVLDKMYELNLDHLRQLDLYIQAGGEMLEELETTRVPSLELEARTTSDALAAQRLADLRQSVTRFERRLHDLKLTRMISIQTAPQVRLIQGNDQNLVEKIQSSITTTVPLWKNQIVIALSLYRQQQALALQRAVTDTANELLVKNAELLRTGSADVARETERGIVDVESLQKVNDELIATLEETIRIQEEGHTRRLQAEGELLRLQSDLRQKLVEIRG
jgi:uncharacterized protein YaaN involved in tellurite resistance